MLRGSQEMLGGSYSYRATEVTWKLLKLMFAEYIIIHMLDILGMEAVVFLSYKVLQ